MEIFTVGHSTREAAEFRELLASHGVRRLVDVRQFPGSRRYPHFSAAQLAQSLAGVDIEYRHESDLGGRRRAQGESPNAYWRNASFRAFADYMGSAEFADAITRLIAEGQQSPTVIMCAEAVPWRCHRWLISDALVARGVQVEHILGPHDGRLHVLNPQAHLDAAGRLTYPASTQATGDPQRVLFHE